MRQDLLLSARQEASNYKYAKSWLALALPLAYCLLDAAGTFADDLVLETLNEDSANVAYELTFLAAGIVCFIYTVIIKKQKLVPKMEAPKYVGAIFETIGAYLAYTTVLYAQFYDMEYLMLLGRVMSGKGGDTILRVCNEVLTDEYPELAAKCTVTLPDEKMRRVGQSVAAASLPELR